MVDRNAAFRQHFLKVAIADRIATIPVHRPQDHITLEMAPLEIRHCSFRPISAKHAQASLFLQQSLLNDDWVKAEHVREKAERFRLSGAVVGEYIQPIKEHDIGAAAIALFRDPLIYRFEPN